MKMWNKKLSDIFPGNGKMAKLVSILFLMAIVAGTYTIANSYNFPVGHTRYAYQNIGIALNFSQLIFLSILGAIQSDTYRLFKLRQDKLDERQSYVRRRIFEKSYKVMALIIFILAYVVISQKNNLFVTDTTSNVAYWIPFSVVVLMAGLPQIFAAWMKDSR